MVKEIVEKSRSCRRFYGDRKITVEQLKELINLARMSPSGANRQPLKYYLICSKEMNTKVFETIGWAGYLKDWKGPVEIEQPTGYIIMLRDTSITKGATMDEGIAAQSIFLGATDMGLGGCFIGNINKTKLIEAIKLPEQYEVALIIALGYPKEEIVLEEMKNDEDFKYYRDSNQVHHVPKRKLEDLIVKEL